MLLCEGPPPFILFVYLYLCYYLQRNGCIISIEGTVKVSFLREETVSFSLPSLYIKGLVWGPRLFYWQGPLKVQGQHMRCTLMVAGYTSKRAPHGGPPCDEVIGVVLPGGPHQATDNNSQGGAPGAPKPLGIITGSYTDRIFWDNEE